MMYVIHYTTNDGRKGSTRAFSEEVKNDMIWWMVNDQGRTINYVEERA